MHQRTSPIAVGLVPKNVGILNGCPVALTYVGEKRRSRLFLTDLSHVPKWAFHRKDVDGAGPFGLEMPRKPGRVREKGDRLVVRLTPTECLLMVLRGEPFDCAHGPEVNRRGIEPYLRANAFQ